MQSKLDETKLDLDTLIVKETNFVCLNFTDPKVKTVLREFSEALASDLIKSKFSLACYVFCVIQFSRFINLGAVEKFLHFSYFMHYA